MTSSREREPTTSDNSGLIIARGLTKRLGQRVAVSNLSFTAAPGTVTGLLGPRGSGKTTTLRMTLGLVAPSAGTATINGVPFAALDWPGRVVGAALDGQAFPLGRKARTHLLVYCAAIGVPDERADYVLDLVGLTGAAAQPVRGYSIGMRQRLALATALLGDPQFLILDEPARGLDPVGLGWLANFVRSFTRSGRTLLIAGESLRDLEQTADTLVILSAGRAVFQGTLSDLRGGALPSILVSCADPRTLAHALVQQQISDVAWRPDGRLAVGGATPAQTAQVARAADVRIYAISDHDADLERIYRGLTTPPPEPDRPAP